MMLVFALFSLLSASFLALGGRESFGQEPAPAVGEKEGKANRLAKETSPYLLLHAHNPVDWYPWGPEALEKAKKENKLIFLSVGYSSCHWCHVMERESFVDEEIAKFLNERFVCIKVDREERPDVDQIYMAGLHTFNRLTRSGRGGGWPLSMFLTPEGEPFFGATYIPARDGDRGVTNGFFTIVKKIDEVWTKDEAKIREDAKTLTLHTKRELEELRPAPEELNIAEVGVALYELGLQFDPKYGGFGFSEASPERPKFPEASNLVFLIDLLKHWDAKFAAEKKALGEDYKEDKEDRVRAEKMLELTLTRMAESGLRDHLGGGFHRYCVDRQWLVPHFEKMLYDQGQLLTVYASEYERKPNAIWKNVVEEQVEFLLREMRSDEQGFYAALDAESDGREGAFYLWKEEELSEPLGKGLSEWLAERFVTEGQPLVDGEIVLQRDEGTLKEEAITDGEIAKTWSDVKAKLFATREKRKRPRTDTKILTSGNGLAIGGLADAGRVFKRPEWVEAASKAADLVLAKLMTSDGKLLRTYTAGEARLNGYVDDYAFLAEGLLALHRAGADVKYRDVAKRIMDKQIELFWDEKLGGFFFTSDDHESLLARAKQATDGAEPSANSVSVSVLLDLDAAYPEGKYAEYAAKTIKAHGMLLTAAPAAAPRMAAGLARYLREKGALDKPAAE
jgi:uncharacterized protein YyaL (SSP411 family)